VVSSAGEEAALVEGQVTLLRVLVDERRLTREEVRRCLVRRASRMQIDQFSIERRQLDRWLNGEVKRLPHPAACRVLEAEFGHPPEKLLAFVGEAPQARDVRELLTGAAATSAAWGRHHDSLGLGPLALEGLRIKVESLAADYVHRPMAPVIHDLVALRNELFEQLMHPEPAQLRDLYLLAGVTCAMLGHGSGNLGLLGAAHDQAQTALICAEKAGHAALSAWAIGVRALQCEWNGRPRDALGLVARALKAIEPKRTAGSIRVWLSAIEARAWARLGHQDAAIEALAATERAADRASDSPDELDGIGGILAFRRPKQMFYAAVVSRRCADLVRAEQYARAAIDGYAAGPAAERSYGDETLTWAELAVARTAGRRPDLDGAAVAIRQVRDLAPHTRIAALADPLRELAVMLAMPRLRAAARAAALREEVRHLLNRLGDPYRPRRAFGGDVRELRRDPERLTSASWTR
jgi:hypothetical protein